MAARAFSRTCSSKSGCAKWLITLFALLLPLPTAFAQALPRVALECPAEILRPAAPFELSITVTWQGNAESHIIVPPEPVLPQGVTMRSTSFEATVSDSLCRLTYRFILTAHTDGQFTVTPVTVLCWPRGSSTELSLQTNACSITVAPSPGLSQKTLMVTAGAGLLFIIAAAVFMIKKRSCSTRP